ncbi:hypothetical protein BD324DRAFT_635737 [Kockovaella imperatae]|uniref:Gylcosyl hydrolase 115 C-terminal domain-containing protein n=1 Tax=Kockovaella imperatae TaxID=4999 RepID=A0A1Y1U8N6_9TREE|nr:hypothetical protein BD324DRAFT_635737 [Kockovaella imperatae]ORX34409.1 hypothetical protein BD324DRAFT_635737 [Kockovaella imperatae]
MRLAWILSWTFLLWTKVISASIQEPFKMSSSTPFVLASSSSALPILLDSTDSKAVHIAANNFASDIHRVTGAKPDVHVDALPSGSKQAIIVCTAGSKLASKLRAEALVQKVEGKWESFQGAVLQSPVDGVEESLVLIGSDRRGAIFAMYTLSEQFGVSPFHWWADVPVRHRDTLSIDKSFTVGHGEPTVKYRGFFLNDEHPVLFNWARQRFGIAEGPPFQVGLYEKVFELLLRLKGNYLWPAMWHSSFAVDGLENLPHPARPGPNQELAEEHGVVMGTSHHEPMSRNQKEYHDFGHGDWDFDTNREFLEEFWTYGADRAKNCETLYTVGMRGDGDLALPGADIERLQTIVKAQQSILKSSLDTSNLDSVPQMWAMYKEVMSYFATGLQVPENVTPLLSDDNWGNLMAIMPEGDHKAGGGIYYHADYVGDPRNYKWLSTVSLAKMWEQLNLARSFNTKNIWILNVGDLKMLEIPLEWFMSLGYDFDRATSTGLQGHLTQWAQREFALDQKAAAEVANIMAQYSMYASRRKAELVDSDTYSLATFNEAERVLAEWNALEGRTEQILMSLDQSTQLAFEQLVRTPIRLQTNLQRIYISAAKSILYASQGRTAANFFAQDAIDCFRKDHEITQAFHKLNDGKWNFTLCQSHIGYQYWQSPTRNALPPISFVQPSPSYINILGPIHTRFTVEGSLGAWPGDNKHNCPLGYNCPDPVFPPVDPYSQKRWVDVGAAGTEDIEFTAKAVEDWVVAHPSNGTVKSDGSGDVRVWISVDWSKYPGKTNDKMDGHVDFTSSDGTKMTVTLPAVRGIDIPSDFKGAIQGDDYIVMEAMRGVSESVKGASGIEHAWKEIPFYGKTYSGMTILPPTLEHFSSSAGPAIHYDFFVTHLDDLANGSDVSVTLLFGPTLNYILGSRLEISVQMDDGSVQSVRPVPESKPGTVPDDWEQVVASEVRQVRIPMELGNKGSSAIGSHRLIIRGVRGGLVLERVLIDLGGISSRAATYLGPPESHIVV